MASFFFKNFKIFTADECRGCWIWNLPGSSRRGGICVTDAILAFVFAKQR
jgi:hypothetical protein